MKSKVYIQKNKWALERARILIFKAMATLYKTDRSILNVEPENNKSFSLEELQYFVNGYIETIMIECEKIMVVNEEGSINGMPLNDNASELAGRFIFGDVLLCKPSEIE